MTPEQFSQVNPQYSEFENSVIALQDSFRAIFTTPDGERVLNYLKKRFFWKKSTQVFGSFDATSYNNGKRDVVEAIVAFIEKDKETLIRELQQLNIHGPNT